MQEKKSKAKATPQRKKTKATPGAERVLVTCAPVLGKVAMDSMADSLLGYIFVENDGQYWQIESVRVSERQHKIYGKSRKVEELAPFMFG